MNYLQRDAELILQQAAHLWVLARGNLNYVNLCESYSPLCVSVRVCARLCVFTCTCVCVFVGAV